MRQRRTPRPVLAVLAIAISLLAVSCGPERAEPLVGARDEEREVLGATVFAERCIQCHAIGGEGLPSAPDLRESRTAARVDDVERAVRHGQGVMPAFEGQLDDEEIEAVASYVAGEIAGRIDLDGRDERRELPPIPEI